MYKISTSTKLRNYLSGILAIGLSFSLSALEPLTETDMDGVSADLGNNLLSVLNTAGAPAAGLTLDSVGGDDDGDGDAAANNDAADKELSTIEEKTANQENEDSNRDLDSTTRISEDTLEHAVEASEVTVGLAEGSFNNSSEVRFRHVNVKHEITEFDSDKISLETDVNYDLIKLENLRGDTLDDNRTFGSVYFSDWSSQSRTTTFVRDR